MLSINSKIKNTFVIIILTCFIFVSATIPLPSKAQGVGYPTFDWATWSATAAGWAKEAARWAKDNAVKIAVKTSMRRLTLSIVDWIDRGFKGNPAFITDTGKFLRDTADITIGDMLMGTDLDFLCDPFKIQVKLALGLQYRPFSDQIKCSFTGVVGNVTDAMNKFTNGDFIGGGGWDAWLQMTTIPQNNQMGALMIAQSELDARISGNKEIQLTEAGWGGGFMSWKDCKMVEKSTGNTSGNQFDSGGFGGTTYRDAITGATSSAATNVGQRVNYYNEKNEIVGVYQESQECTIQTPGSVISNKIGWADTTDIRQVELANDINAIVSALANQAVLRTTGLLKMGSGTKKSSTVRQDNIDYLNSLQAQQKAQGN